MLSRLAIPPHQNIQQICAFHNSRSGGGFRRTGAATAGTSAPASTPPTWKNMFQFGGNKVLYK